MKLDIRIITNLDWYKEKKRFLDMELKADRIMLRKIFNVDDYANYESLSISIESNYLDRLLKLYEDARTC